jgi:kinesin family protein C2/C3
VRGESSNLSETHATLNFGQNIRKIELGPATKHKTTGPPPPPVKAAPKK